MVRKKSSLRLRKLPELQPSIAQGLQSAERACNSQSQVAMVSQLKGAAPNKGKSSATHLTTWIDLSLQFSLCKMEGTHSI